ncbi:histone-like nucleoid-structuring protein Lsr2 [Streptomyces sp. NPDC002698]|uniref:Lsr2 family DNA-binding protein n=1 Tax=Streptomyces sp. NPDC002698 TaxID=3364660 RepID=UPI00368EE38D
MGKGKKKKKKLKGAVTVHEMSDVAPPPVRPVVVDLDYDPEDVAAWCLRQPWLGMTEGHEDWQKREFFPQLISLYKERRAEELKREAREREKRAEDERRAAESRAAAEKWRQHKELMRDMRKWGPENGFFVGTRGRIPRKVIEAYEKAKGL